jgi:hypothetical protein
MRIDPDEIHRTLEAMRDGSFWKQTPKPVAKAAPYTSRASQSLVTRQTLPVARPEQHDDDAQREADDFSRWLEDV